MNLGPALVYLLCLLTSTLCAVLLTRSYRRDRSRLLLWVALGFSGLALNNLVLVIDLLLLPTVDLWVWRQVATGAAICVFLCGFLSELG